MKIDPNEKLPRERESLKGMSREEYSSIPHFSPRKVVLHGENVPRYFYHVGDIDSKGNVKSYKIREPEAADNFGKGFAENQYVWLSQTPFCLSENFFVIDITKLNNNDMRFTGQIEGHLLHKGDIPAEAVVGRGGSVLNLEGQTLCEWWLHRPK